MMQKIKLMSNHMKNNDFATIITDYESIHKMLDKLKSVVEQDGGPPSQFVKAIAGLENYLNEKKAKKDEKLSQNKAQAFNTLCAKVKKGNRNYEDLLKRFQEHPEEFEEEEEEEEEEDEQSDSDSES